MSSYSCRLFAMSSRQPRQVSWEAATREASVSPVGKRQEAHSCSATGGFLTFRGRDWMGRAPPPLTWHRDHWSPSPEHIHPCGVAVTKGSVQADIGQLAPPHVLFFGSNRGEDDAVLGQAHVLGILLDIWLPHGWESQ